MPIFFPKKYLIIFLIVFFLLADAHLALAASKKCKFAAASGVNPAMVIKCILDEFGINKSTVQNVANVFEVANNKKLAPQVTLTFTPVNPVPGEKVTATALPLYFGNPTPSLYYTWFLGNSICPPNDGLGNHYPYGSSLDLKCNLDRNFKSRDNGDRYGIVDIEDYKIKAMRIYVNDGFEWQDINYNDTSIGDDADGYKAINGGEDQRGKADHCYFQDVLSGNIYEFPSCFHLFPNAPGYATGDELFGKGEEQFWRTNPDDPDTAQTGHLDEANLAGLGAISFSWIYQAGDQVGVTIEGVASDPTDYKDSSLRIMWATLKNDCDISSEYFDEPTGGGGSYETRLDPEAWPDCPDGCEFTRTLTKEKPTTNQATDSGYITEESEYFIKTETIQLASRRRISAGETVTDPLILPTTGDYQTAGTCNKIDTDSLVDSDFFSELETQTDEQKRIALSTNQSCCPAGFNASDGTPLCSITYSSTEIVDSLDNTSLDTLFNMSDKSFSQCLLDNMIAPTEGGGKNEKIEVSLSYSPENPVNDTSVAGDSADWINVSSTIENSTKTESLRYNWKVYAGESPDPEDESWDLLLKSDLIGAEQTEGVGIPNLKFKANFSEEPHYLKVKLNVEETISSGNDAEAVRKGHAETIIPLSSFNNALAVFSARVTDTLELTLDNEEEKLCQIYGATEVDTLVDAAVCQVAPNDIIAVKANIATEAGETVDDYDFLWTINNQTPSYSYDPDFTKPSNLIFFPVLDSKGSTLNLNLTATHKETGAKISLNKTFLVSEPDFKVVSLDESTSYPKILGNYVDLEGVQWPDYSQTDFLGLKDSVIQLSVEQLSSLPLPSEEDLSLRWYWDGTELSETGRTLSFNATDDIAGSFSLSAEGLYTQDINTKKALNAYWGVPINGFYEKFLSKKINFSVVDSFGEVNIAKNHQQKVLASFISSVPAYFAFLFRIVMTTFVLISTIWILFVLFPQVQKND